MRALQRCSALLLCSLVIPLSSAEVLASGFQPDGSQAPLLARGGGGGGGGGRMGGGGFGGGGGGGARFSGGASRAQTGFQGAGGGFNRGDVRPTGGWSNRVGSDSARPSLDRNAINRDRQGIQPINRDAGRNGNRDWNNNLNRNTNFNRNTNVNRNWNRTVNVNNLNLSPGWARPGWGVARPWGYGWYGVSAVPAWGWWGARAATWGIATLTTAAIINGAVNNAIASNTSYIVVPNSSYQLLYGTVAPTSDSAISFDVTANGTTYQLSADCRGGTLNGQQPNTAAEAELLNAACQVAFGNA